MLARTLLATAAVAAAVALGACGSDDAADDARPAAGTTAAPADAFPVTIEHKFGSTTIEEEPTRVVAAGFTDQDVVLALGVTPVGVREFLGGYDWTTRPWAKDVLKGAQPKVISRDELDVEAIAAARPDVIIALTSGLTERQYRQLSRVAPVVAQDGAVRDYGMTWQDQTRVVGRALGRTETAEALVSDIEERFAQVRREHPEFAGRTAILAYGGPDGYGAYTTEDTRSRFLTDLGFRLPTEVDDLAGDSFYTAFSAERFRLLDQDVVLMYGTEKDLKGDRVFSRLDAVGEDRVVYLDLADQVAGALGFSSPLSLPYLLDEVVPQLAAAVDGDPATRVVQPR